MTGNGHSCLFNRRPNGPRLQGCGKLIHPMPIATHGGFEIPLRSRVGIHLLDLAPRADYPAVSESPSVVATL